MFMRDLVSAEDGRNDLSETGSNSPVTLSVIFPAFNEEANIRHTVEAARIVLPKLARTWEIILVNDGSRDATTPICDELADQYPEVRAIHHVENRGYGAALKSGILAARYDYIFFTDSDGQFDLQELERLIGDRRRARQAVDDEQGLGAFAGLERAQQLDAGEPRHRDVGEDEREAERHGNARAVGNHRIGTAQRIRISSVCTKAHRSADERRL